MSDEPIYVTGTRTDWADVLLRDGGPLVVGLLLIAVAVSPALRRWFTRTPFASFLLVISALGVGLDHAQLWLNPRWNPAAPTAFGRLPWDQYADFLEPSLIIFRVAIVFFVVMQLVRAVVGGGRAVNDAGAIDIPARNERLHFPLSPSAVLDFFRQRQRLISDPNTAVELVEDPNFNPVGFAARGAAIAGLPAAVFSILQTVAAFVAQPVTSIPTSFDQIAIWGVIGVADVFKAILLPIALLLTTTYAAWAIVWFRGGDAIRAARQLYLVTDSARGVFAVMLSALIVAAFCADGGYLPAYHELERSFGVWSAAAIFALGWVPFFWLGCARLLIVPVVVARLLGPSVAGSIGGAVFRHALLLAGPPAAFVGLGLWLTLTR